MNDCLRDALQWSTELGDEGGALRSAATAANAALKPCLDPSCILQPGAASSFRARLRPLRARSNVALAVSQLDKVSRQATEAATHAGTLTLGGQALRLGTLAGLALLRRERCQYGGRLAAEVRARREARRDSAFARVVAEIQREGGTLFRRLAAALGEARAGGWGLGAGS